MNKWKAKKWSGCPPPRIFECSKRASVFQYVWLLYWVLFLCSFQRCGCSGYAFMSIFYFWIFHFFFSPCFFFFFVGFSEYSCSLCVRVFPQKFRLFVCRCLYVRMRLEVCVSVCFAYASVVVDSKRNLRVEPPRNDSDLGRASPALFRLRGCWSALPLSFLFLHLFATLYSMFLYIIFFSTDALFANGKQLSLYLSRAAILTHARRYYPFSGPEKRLSKTLQDRHTPVSRDLDVRGTLIFASWVWRM